MFFGRVCLADHSLNQSRKTSHYRYLKMPPKFLIALVFGCISTASSQSPGIFINPSPQQQSAAAFGTGPLSGNAVYTVGNLLNVTWVPLEAGAMTIVMWQVDPERPTDQIGDLQYLPGSSKTQQIADSTCTILKDFSRQPAIFILHLESHRGRWK